MNPTLDAVHRGVPSVCSAHPLVIEAALDHAGETGTVALIEATSNQVDQFGGYTGMRPLDFRENVERIARDVGLPADRIILGGDHLGPNRWRDLPAAEAMSHAEDLVRSYVSAGYTKIHLDCSYRCADDGPLTDEVVAGRAARMLAAAEDEGRLTGRQALLRYVIGTEVPPPGGASHRIDALVPTTAVHARLTLRHHRDAFEAAGLGHVWPRVQALVVQPGVEFDQLRVVDYDAQLTAELRAVLDTEPGMTFEAHSTDYQTEEALATLVADGWHILKVGPGLTFALREALFALAAIEAETVAATRRSDLPAVMEARMLASPGYWEPYCDGDPAAQRTARVYGYSDRMRYYWPDAAVDDAVQTLLANLRGQGIPEPMLSAHLPRQYARVRAGLVDPDPKRLVIDHIQEVLRSYSRACGQMPAPETGLVPCR